MRVGSRTGRFRFTMVLFERSRIILKATSDDRHIFRRTDTSSCGLCRDAVPSRRLSFQLKNPPICSFFPLLHFSAGRNELPDFLLIHVEASPFWQSFYHGKETLHTNRRLICPKSRFHGTLPRVERLYSASAGRNGSVSASMPSEESIAASSSSRAITSARSVLLMDSALLYFGVLLAS